MNGGAMRLFDSHCHLQDERIFEKAGELLARARASGVVRTLCCGTSESDWGAVVSLTQRYPDTIVPAFGLHPWFVRERSDQWLEILERLLIKFPAAAVGEIGIDHAQERRNDGEQAAVFISQFKLAQRLNRPVSLHCRNAWGMMMDLLEKQGGTPDGGVVHSFSGPPAHVPRLEKLNVSISFSGSITYHRNKRGHMSCRAVSERHLLVETDSPDIPPAGVRQGCNEPAFCADILKKMAVIRETTPEQLGEITFRNASRVFHLKE